MLVSMVVSGCSFQSPDEKAIQEMLKTFTAAIAEGDDDLSRACLMDVDAFHILNPDLSARTDSESYTATVIAELIEGFRDLKQEYQGHELELKSIRVGDQWYQYKGKQAFKNTVMIVEVDGQEVEIPILGVVLVGQQWRIVSLSRM
jgi:restriction endonuclease S subunit